MNTPPARVPRMPAPPRRARALTARLMRVRGAVLLGLLVALPAAADDERWKVRVLGSSLVDAGGSLSLSRGETQTVQEISGAEGLLLSVERRIRGRLSVEASALFADLDHLVTRRRGDATSFDASSLGTETYTLGVNWTFAQTRRVDAFAGVFGGIMFNEDVTIFRGRPDAETFRFDDDLGPGAKLGVDVRFSPRSRWGLSAEARWMSVILESEIAGEDLSVDPLALSVDSRSGSDQADLVFASDSIGATRRVTASWDR